VANPDDDPEVLRLIQAAITAEGEAHEANKRAAAAVAAVEKARQGAAPE
jgi:hypothetical protein